jgi:glycerate dehydrogenase
MKIVVLDGYTLNPGDLDWGIFDELGDISVYERSDPAEVPERLAGAEAALVNKVIIDRSLLQELPGLKYVGVLATGCNNIDITAACDHGVVVTNVPEYSTNSVAQMVFAHLLNLCHHVADHSRTVHAGKWSRSRDFCYWDYPQIELDGLVMGIVGFGRIGRRVAEIAQAFGMRVLANNRSPISGQPAYVEAVGLAELFERSDVLSLHCPLNDENRGFVNAELLARMRPGAFLINTSRGPLVDEAALAAALARGCPAGAALDVLSLEPPPPDNPLLTAERCQISPHIAWATLAARRRLMRIAHDNLRSFLEKCPVNVVTLP